MSPLVILLVIQWLAVDSSCWNKASESFRGKSSKEPAGSPTILLFHCISFESSSTLNCGGFTQTSCGFRRASREFLKCLKSGFFSEERWHTFLCLCCGVRTGSVSLFIQWCNSQPGSGIEEVSLDLVEAFFELLSTSYYNFCVRQGTHRSVWHSANLNIKGLGSDWRNVCSTFLQSSASSAGRWES